jgi:hypothetical protein
MTEWKFYREGGSEPEPVPLEPWRWEAHYTDGTVLKQFGDDQIYHQFREINQPALANFRMVSDGQPPMIIQWRDGLKLIHFYRNCHFNVGTDNEIRARIYCFGYEDAAAKVLLAIMPDGGVVVTDSIDTVTLVA